NDLRAGHIDPFATMFDTPSSVSIYIRPPNDLCIDATLTTYSTTAPGIRISCNEFSVSAPGTDQNSDDRALEVVDEKGRPISQLIFESPGRIAIRGRFTVQGGSGTIVRLLTETGSRTNPPPDAPAPTAIFRYPSWQHRGEYVHH